MIIAHRGAMGYAPENTLAAIKLGIELGATAIEIDLRQTKDGIPAALHDATVDGTTNGSGNIKDYTFTDLKKFDAGSWFSSEFSKETIPSLQEIIDILPDNILLIIELKEGNETYPKIEENTVSLIKENKIDSQVILKSFDPNVLERLRVLAPNIPQIYVYTFRIPWLGMIIDRGITFRSVYNFDVEYLQPHRFFLSESFVKDAQAAGFKIIAWGVDSEEAIKEALEFGVDGIETDYPDRVIELMKLKNSGVYHY